MTGPRAVALAALLALSSVAVAGPLASPTDAGSTTPTGTVVTGVSTQGPQTNINGAWGADLDQTVVATPVVPQGDTPEFLALPRDQIVNERVQFDTTVVDMSGALAADTGGIEGEFTRRWVEEAYASADDEPQRRQALRAAAARLERRVTELHSRERAALQAYNAGELSAEQYLQTLAALDAKARTLEGAVGRLETYTANFSPRPVNQERVGRIYERVQTLQGPVRQHVRRAYAGQAMALRVYVETSTDGVVLASAVRTEDGPRYIREAYLPSARDPEAPDSLAGDPVQAFDRMADLYPWSWENQNGVSTGQPIGSPRLFAAGVYPIAVDHEQGRLTVYLDGGTNTTFLEYQQLQLDHVPTGSPVDTTDQGINLQVNRTRVGGPLLVQVTNQTTREPIDAMVEIDGTTVGRTGADGRVWAVTPQGRFDVNVTSEGRNVSLRTFSLRPEQTEES